MDSTRSGSPDSDAIRKVKFIASDSYPDQMHSVTVSEEDEGVITLKSDQVDDGTIYTLSVKRNPPPEGHDPVYNAFSGTLNLSTFMRGVEKPLASFDKRVDIRTDPFSDKIVVHVKGSESTYLLIAPPNSL